MARNKYPEETVEKILDVAERLYKPPWRATIRALPKNMRKIERRLSLPNRSNGIRKSAGETHHFAGR